MKAPRLILAALLLAFASVAGAQTGPGSALSFDGVNNQVSVTNYGNQIPTNEITVEFWQKVNGQVSQATFALASDVITNRFNAHVPWSDGKVYWDFGNQNTTGELNYTPPVSLVGSWQHFALVSSQSGNYMRIFRNGVQEAAKVGRTPFIRGAYDLKIGGNAFRFAGTLDEFRIWNTALSTNQIQTNMNRRLVGNEPGLVLYYRCDEGSGTSAGDSSLSAISGVLQSSAMWVASTAPIGPPQLVTLPATGLATNVATLNATVNPSGQASAYYFQWGTTTNYGNTTAVTSAGNGTSPVAINAAISGVATEVLYHCRVVATNNGGTGYGADQTFIRLLPGPVNAVSLDGIDDFIFTPDLNAALAGRTMTAEIWFKANGAGVILDERGQLPTAPSQDWLDSQIEVLAGGEVQVAVWHLPAVSLGTVTFGTWNHAVVRYNHATKTLDGFLNGVQSATSSTNAAGRLLPADFTINALYYGIGLPDNVNPLGGGAAFSGQVDEFRVWSSARTPAEILANMNRKLSGTESNLLVYYRFNEGTGTIANDSSPNGNTGSLNNGPAWVASTAPVDLLTAVTQPATTVRDTNATLNATVNPNASTTTVYFQYGLTTNYGSVTATINVGAGSNTVSLTNLLTGLAPLTTYHFRVIATNIAGSIGTGGDQVFTTQSAAGTALSFDGVNDFLLTANLRTNFPSETMTVELWFNANGAGVILDERGQRDLTGWDNSQMEILANGDVIVRVWNLTPVNIGNAAFGVWNHAALRYDKAGLKVDGFLNGVPSGFSSGDRQMPYEFNGAFGFYYAFGLPSGASLGSGAAFNGLMDEIRIWNTARSASQIQTNRNRRLVGNESGLVAYYRLDEGSGLTAGDATTNGFTGTLSNGVAWVSSTIPIAPPGAVLTSAAQPVGQTFATLNGSLIPLGQTAAGYFQYGLTTAYGSTSAAAGAGNGTNAAPVSVFVSGLTAATTYHYRLVATNNSGTTLGQDLAFTTTQPGPGTAVSFDGVDDRVLVANFCATAPTTEITIELWQKVSALAEQATFTVNSPSVNNLINAHIPYSDGVVYWDFGDFASGGRLSYTPPQSIVGTWQHFALVASQSGNFMRIYRNGVLEAQKAGMTPFTQGNFNLYIGGNGLPFAGVIDEFRVWNTARTGPQIQASFGRQLTGIESNLVLYFRFDEGAGPSVSDASGHGLTGQLQNGTAWVTSGAAIDLPLAISLAATNVGATNATLTGTVNPNGIATTAYYEWGTTTGYGSFSATNSAGSGTNAAPLLATINGLTPGATYHYRLVATNNIGAGYGVDQSFVTPVPGPGTALNLDGISDYIITPNLVSAFSNETVTIELWFNATAAGVLLDERGQADTAPSQDWLDSQIEVLASGQVKVAVYPLTPVSVGTVSFGTWNHVVLRYDKVAQRLDGFLNGVPSAGSTTGERFSPFEAGFDLYYAIGRGDLVNPIATGAYFTGKVDEFRIWTSARSTAQILSNMNHRLTGTESNLLVYYRFDEGTGTVAFDATTNHLDGAARNNVPWTGSAAVVGLPVATTTAATLVTATTARLNGTVDPDSVNSSGFFHWGTTTNYGNSTGLTNVGGGTSLVAISNTLSGLTPGTTYHFRAVASNSVGLHLDGDQTFTTTLDPPTVTTLAATNITSTSATVNGSANPNGLATTYSFQYGPTTSYGSTSSVVSAGSGIVPVAVSNNLAGLTPGVLYHFRVVAGNGAGTNAGGDLTFTTGVAVPVATTLAASGVASSSATLNGTVIIKYLIVSVN